MGGFDGVEGMMLPQPAPVQYSPPATNFVASGRCPYCDDTGDVHTPTGEWRGTCACPAGVPVFNSEWRKSCTVRKCSIVEVDAFIAAHYLAKRPAIVLLCLVAERHGAPIGCIVYSAPPREVDKRYGGKTWELARLYLLDTIPRNAETWLIGASVRYIKRNHPEVQNLLSYADPSAGHSGTIYKAANWRADGRTDDERKTPRCDYYDERTGQKYGRRGNMPADAVVIRRPRVSKFRFALAMKVSKCQP